MEIPNRSLLRTKSALERAIQKAKTKQRVSPPKKQLQAKRTPSWSLPLELPREQLVSILDQDAPNIPVHVLRPGTVSVSPQEAPRILQRTVNTVSDWMRWLASEGGEALRQAVSPRLEALRNQILRLWEERVVVEEGPSAFKRFLREHRISGPTGDHQNVHQKDFKGSSENLRK